MSSSNTALIVMDLQPAILGGIPETSLNALLSRIKKAIEAAHRNKIPVILRLYWCNKTHIRITNVII